MTWFEYKYSEASEIFKNIKLIYEYSISDYIVLIWWILFIVLFSMYIIPITKVIIVNRKKEKEKRKRKNIMKKILLQKDIEDSISKELWIKD